MTTFFNELVELIGHYWQKLVEVSPKLLVAGVVLAACWMAGSLLKNALRKFFNKRMDDPLSALFLARIGKFTIVIIGMMLALKVVGLGNLVTGILAGAGVSAFIIGFAFKDIGENFLSGLILAFKRPFRVGDTVELNGHTGVVQGLDLRTTWIKSFDGKDIYIPNADVIKNAVVNHTIDGFLRYEFPVLLEYGSDLGMAADIIKNSLLEVPGVQKDDRLPSVSVKDLTSSNMQLVAYYWLDMFDENVDNFETRIRAVHAVFDALQHAGYYLPADVMEVKNYKDQLLATKS